MRVALFQLDGFTLPNLAIMAAAAHHRARGDAIELRAIATARALERDLWPDEAPPDRVYASLLFDRTRPLAERLLKLYPGALVGGTGWSVESKLEDVGITTKTLDYSIYPTFAPSIGFTQRGCRLKCPFCVVPRKEGPVRAAATIAELWRGEGHPKDVILLDNDFFGQEGWRERIAEIRDGRFRVSFSQGINARLLTDEAAEAIASVSFWNARFTEKFIYTAWDNMKDEERLFAGLRALVRYGVKPRQILVYVLVGYWPGETEEDRLFRVRKLLDFGARPYPMPFDRKRQELTGLLRWCVGGYARKGVPWEAFKKARFDPTRIPIEDERQKKLFEA